MSSSNIVPANMEITKFLLIGITTAAVVSGVFGLKSYFHINYALHLASHYQYWRLLIWQLVYWNSTEVLQALFILYQARDVERLLGSHKYASFCTYSFVVGTLITPLFCFPIAHFCRSFEYVHPGPTFIVFAILYQYFYVVPSTVYVRISEILITDKVQMLFPLLGLALSNPPSTFFNALFGWTFGMLYCHGLFPYTSWRLPARFVPAASLTRQIYIRPPHTDSQASLDFDPSALFPAFAANFNTNPRTDTNPDNVNGRAITPNLQRDTTPHSDAEASGFASGIPRNPSFRSRPATTRQPSASVLPTGPASQLYDMISGRSERPELAGVREEDVETVQTIMQTTRAQAVQALSQTNDVQRAVELLLEQ
ncbi:UBA domain-containing protein Ucp14 [Schizosaccharomyces octosporus yFS286]|uniref:UBA domain-containing protein Ucp14 n=1 Tax=Schizosaccharomyces octosporus (strain yFS286) TaxID=483514 RepID=S9RB74_SCHOY|nr:UBA domain-containing protein Ucp14 [Schizosaccharomyces octosporus yFS286]EPX71389.1 UBA domain-containing protein Ucp14 [Schizosaccharomyces octosporus yFS286]